MGKPGIISPRGLALAVCSVLFGQAASGCTTTQRQEPSPGPADPCVLLPEPAQSPDSIVIALFEDVDPAQAPGSHDYDARFVFHHLYEPLVGVDCTGEIRPALAETWRRLDGGRAWRFGLRRDARFWDGEPVTAGSVVASWEAGAWSAEARFAGIDSVRADGEREVLVYLSRGVREAPRVLADPVFAVARRSSDSSWPVGTGRYRVEKPGEGGTTGLSASVVLRSAREVSAPVVVVAVAAGDARDPLDRGADLLVTSNPAVIEYAGRLEYSRVALPWDRTYLLLSTTRVQALRLGGELGGLSTGLLDALARDAVRGDARSHTQRFESAPDRWNRRGACGDLADVVDGLPPVPQGAYSGLGARRVVFDAADPVAQGLAERVVALAAGGPQTASEAASLAAAIPGLGDRGARLRAEGLTTEELARSLRDGDDFAYVVPIGFAPLDTCYELRKLVGRAQWLAVTGLDLSSAVLPLVDTRRHVIARRGAVGLSLQGDGTVTVMSRQESETRP